MKKLFYSALALAGIFAVSCNKEKEQVAPAAPVNTHTVTISATFGEETRTAYANDKTFSWNVKDSIYVLTSNDATGYIRFAKFYAQSSGVTVDFKGEVEDGYEPYAIAVYTAADSYVAFGSDEEDDNIYVNLPGSTYIDGTDPNYYTVSSSNPLANLPLVGVQDEGGVYAFHSAMGVVKFTLTDLDPSARWFELLAADGNMLQGHFAIDFEHGGVINRDGGREGTYTYNDRTYRYSYSNLFYNFTPASDGTVTIYVPVPIGTLGAGATITIMDDDSNVLFERTTTKDIEVARNKVTVLSPLKAKYDWQSLGKGKYIDKYIWELAEWNTEEYVDVDIYRDSSDPNTYKIANPYGAAATKFSYTPAGTVTPASDALIITVTSDDHVEYSEHQTGVYEEEYNEGTLFFHPKNYYGYGRNIVAKYGSNGIPANVLLAPIYEWENSGYWTASNFVYSNDVIQILFPGVTHPVELSSYVSYGEIVDDSPAQPVASFSIEFGADMASAQVVCAVDETAAVAALADASLVTTVSEDGPSEVKLPANAPSGDYKVYARVSPKEGLTQVSTDMISSTAFKYISADENKNYQLSDIVGVYATDPMYIAYVNKGSWKWEKGTFYIVIEESGDDLLGNIMISEIAADHENAGFDLYPNTDNVYPMYGVFNTRSGEISFEPCQPFYEHEGNGDYWTLTGERDDNGMSYFMSEPGKLESIGRLFLASLNTTTLAIQGYYRIIGGSPGVNLSFTRQEDDGVDVPMAPAARREGVTEKTSDAVVPTTSLIVPSRKLSTTAGTSTRANRE